MDANPSIIVVSPPFRHNSSAKSLKPIFVCGLILRIDWVYPELSQIASNFSVVISEQTSIWAGLNCRFVYIYSTTTQVPERARYKEVLTSFRGHGKF